MDDAEQALAYARADFSEANSLFVDTFGLCFPDFQSGRILDLGCGPADIPMRFARRYPQAEIVAVDGAPAMIALARSAVDDAGLANRIRLRVARLGQWSGWDPLERFDAVISNSLLHHLEDPGSLWAAIRRHAVPGAPILVMDLFRPTSTDAARQIVETYSADEPEVLKRDFFNSLLAAYGCDEVRAQVRTAGLRGLDVEQLSDRHLAVHGRLG